MIKNSIVRYKKELSEMFSDNKFVVFLCGPSMVVQPSINFDNSNIGFLRSCINHIRRYVQKNTNANQVKPGAKLREQIKNILEDNGFEVVLGEDDGLEDVRINIGAYAHTNELLFVTRQSNALILIADSVGSFCELGLFSYIKALNDRKFPDFILIVNREYEGHKSYFSEGPTKAVKHNGLVLYEDFEKFDPKEMLERLNGHRTVFIMDKKGRPPKRSGN